MDREESQRERERDGEISFTHTPDYVYKCGRKRERERLFDCAGFTWREQEKQNGRNTCQIIDVLLKNHN